MCALKIIIFSFLTAELLTRIRSTLKPSPDNVHYILTHYKWIWDIINNISYLRDAIMSYVLTCKLNDVAF